MLKKPQYLLVSCSFIILPVFVFAQTKTVSTLIGTIAGYFNIVLELLMGAAVVIFIYYIIEYFIKPGSSREEAAPYVMWSITGFFIILSMWGIVNVLIKTFDLGQSNPTSWNSISSIFPTGSSGSSGSSGTSGSTVFNQTPSTSSSAQSSQGGYNTSTGSSGSSASQSTGSGASNTSTSNGSNSGSAATNTTNTTSTVNSSSVQTPSAAPATSVSSSPSSQAVESCMTYGYTKEQCSSYGY